MVINGVFQENGFFFLLKFCSLQSLYSKMALRNFYNEIKGLKVKELPKHVKPMLSINYVKSVVQRGLDNYHAKYIQTSSIDPLYHVCFGGMIFSYLVALPEERRHLEHQQHAKEHGGHWWSICWLLQVLTQMINCGFFFLL